MMRREFSGRHMAMVMIGFFGVIIAVNLLMATLAVRTFGGTVVDNSYVASQEFNGWLAEAREQAALRWKAPASLDETGRLIVSASGPAGPLVGAQVEVRASHPLGRVPEQVLALKPAGSGVYRSALPIPEGRWLLRLSIKRDGHEARYLTEVSR
jgi:nitrogen fixation protein FixH